MLRDLKQPRDTEVPDINALSLKVHNVPIEVTVSPVEANDGIATAHTEYKGLSPAPSAPNTATENPLGLSPVAESFDNASEEAPANSHGRKVSAPVVSTTVKDFTVRARAATSSAAGAANRAAMAKRRGSYMLFPQV